MFINDFKKYLLNATAAADASRLKPARLWPVRDFVPVQGLKAYGLYC